MTYNVNRVVAPGSAVFVVTAAASGPAPKPQLSSTASQLSSTVNPVSALRLLVKSTVLATISPKRSITVFVFEVSFDDLARLTVWYGPPVAEAGSVAISITLYPHTPLLSVTKYDGHVSPTAGIIPVSGLLSLSVSINEVTPSLLYKKKLVPLGNVDDSIVTLKISSSLPVFQM